jgi:hypothetical protein
VLEKTEEGNRGPSRRDSFYCGPIKDIELKYDAWAFRYIGGFPLYTKSFTYGCQVAQLSLPASPTNF